MGAKFSVLWHIMILNCCVCLTWPFVALYGLLWPQMVLFLLFTSMTMCVPIRNSMALCDLGWSCMPFYDLTVYGILWSFGQNMVFSRYVFILEVLPISNLSTKVQSIQIRRISVEKLLVFEIAAFSRHLDGEGKKGGTFKTKKFFNGVASFLCWLYFTVWQLSKNYYIRLLSWLFRAYNTIPSSIEFLIPLEQMYLSRVDEK